MIKASKFRHVKTPFAWGERYDRPLLLIIHPGNAIESGSNLKDLEEMRGIIDFSIDNQMGMAEEIKHRIDSHDIFILHSLRSSEMYANRRKKYVNKFYMKMLDTALLSACVYFGEDAAAAGRLICDKWMTNGKKIRPGVHILGGYSAKDEGSIAIIADLISECHPQVPIAVSEHTPTDDCNYKERWGCGDSMLM